MMISIGFSRSRRTDGYDYVPGCDGFVPGAAVQDTVRLDLPDELVRLTRAQLAEAVFAATNLYGEEVRTDPAERAIQDAIAALPPEQRRQVRSLSVGDTVLVDNVELACESVGFTEVSTALASRPYGPRPA